ncbi:helix-turn-helix domain-containing protein [Nocardia carnea]|uniref:helix-turn-helix domain-containing protein n=1 Tax=Nocardia carnea TaxID=37328 RepID=UPI002458C877|nr:helix-turn-helix transcriptional regulator [Nocardia carnea]
MASDDGMGQSLRRIRHARGKSLAVVAGLAGISTSYLSRLESGERALDRRSLIIALADALEVAPSEITRSGIGLGGELDEDRSLGDVRLSLLQASIGASGGEIVAAPVLKTRANAVLEAQRRCDYSLVGSELPSLVRDLHTSIAAGRDDEDLLKLAVLTHVQGTQAWLSDIGAGPDLAWQATVLARQAAERLDDPLFGAVSAFGTTFGLLSAGGFDAIRALLAAAEPGTATTEAMQVSGMLALTNALVAAAQGNAGERRAALEHAADLAVHTGDANAMWFGFGPSNVGIWQMSVALEAGEHQEAAAIAETVDPRALSATRQAAYYREYGRALARLPKRQTEAVLMLRRAEKISPARIHRHPFMRAVLTELLARAKKDAVGRELRGMAYRSGLPL